MFKFNPSLFKFLATVIAIMCAANFFQTSFRLRTDHRQKAGEKLKMINGAVYRSSQTKLVKANPSGASSSALVKHRQLTKSEFFRGFVIGKII